MAEQHEPGGYLRATLGSQPGELARLLSDDSAERAASRLRDCPRIFLVGTGTSFHAAHIVPTPLVMNTASELLNRPTAPPPWTAGATDRDVIRRGLCSAGASFAA